MSRETKHFLRSAATVMVILAMLFAFAISGVRLFGLQVYGVLTGSMEPSYPTGSLVYVKAVDPATLKVSDVITFSMSRNAVATHRIVEKVPDPNNPYSYSFRTKGDANENVDNALVAQSNIIGKVVFSLPMMGHIASYIQKPPGTYVAILISLILIAFVFITDNVNEQPSNRRQGQRGFRSPSIWQRINAFAEKNLPFLSRRKPTKDNHLRQGYTPTQQRPNRQNQYDSQPQPRYPSQPQQYPQYRQPQQRYQQYPQQRAQYPSQQYPQYQQPRQQYPSYPQQREQYPPTQTSQQYPQYPYPRQQQYTQQQPQYQYPRQQQYPQQQQPSQRYPRQNPYEQLPSQQDWPRQGQPRRSRGQYDDAEDRQQSPR